MGFGGVAGHPVETRVCADLPEVGPCPDRDSPRPLSGASWVFVRLPRIPSRIPVPSCAKCLVSVLASLHQTFWLQAPPPAPELTLTCGLHLQKRIVPASSWDKNPIPTQNPT